LTVNLFGDEWDDERERPGWQWKKLGVGRRLGAEKIGASLYELAPGQQMFPYHWHQLMEEWVIVFRGEATLRDSNGERRIAAGDCVVFRTGPEGGHSVRNDTDEPVRLMMFSSESDAEMIVYPDSGKVGLYGEDLLTILDQSAELDYFHGEE